MAVYEILTPETVGYFTDFEKAREVLRSKPKSDLRKFQEISLLKIDEETGEFYNNDNANRVNIYESDRCLRELTSKEKDRLSELYVNCHSYVFDLHNCTYYSIFINELSYLKDSYLDDVSAIHEHEDCECLFKHIGHLGPFEENYALYMIFDYVIQFEGWVDFEFTLESIKSNFSKHTHAKVKLNELVEHMDIMNHISIHTEKKLRLAFDMAKIHVELMNS